MAERDRITRPDGSPIRVVVVDDAEPLSDLLAMALRYEGWNVVTAATGRAGLRAIRDHRPDVVVLDIMLPDLDGLSVLSEMRAAGDDVPVLFLTAKDAVSDRVTGLTVGGDDYVTKPFSLEELVARLRALLRRSASLGDGGTPGVIRVGDLKLDEDAYEVSRAGTPIELTAREFELLRYLMRNPRRVVSKDQILDRVWSYDAEVRPTVVELYISYLRKKVDSIGEPMIHTVRGFGYVLKVPS